MFAMPSPMLRRPVPAYRASPGASFQPDPPGAAGPCFARIARAPVRGRARLCAGAVRAPDCPRARSGPRAHLTRSPGKGPKNRPAARAAGLTLLCTEGNIMATISDFNPPRGAFSGATNSARRRRHTGPGHYRPISAVSVSNSRRQAGQRCRTVSASMRCKRALPSLNFR